MAYRTGRRAVELVWEDVKPSDILTREAFLNAVRVNSAIGGSTNAQPHLAAMAIASVDRSGRHTLTEKQQRILNWVAQGLRSKQIAYELGVSVRTVESHKYTMMQQLGVHGTLELVRRAHELGLIKAFRDVDRSAA